MLIAIDLFSGCGGMTLGFKNAGFNVVAAYDNWKPAIDVYKINFPDHKIVDFDLSFINQAVEHIRQWNSNIIIGGPPCQDFSHAGHRKEGVRANLTEAFAGIVSQISPEWFVMENVERTRNSKAYEKARTLFMRAGYGLTEMIIDASYCGAPQKRKRFLCIGKMNAIEGFMKKEIEQNLSEKPMTIREYFGNSLDVEYFYRHPRNYNRRAIFSIDEPSPTIRGVNRPIPKGYKGHPNDPITSNSLIRPLTTLERAQIQTFPNNFLWKGTKTDVEQMIGNAVPVKLAEFIGKIILKADNKDFIKDAKIAS